MASALRMIGKVGEHGGTIAVKGAIGYSTARGLVHRVHGRKDREHLPGILAAAGKGTDQSQT